MTQKAAKTSAPKTPSVQIGIRIPKTVMDGLKEVAEKEDRSVTKVVIRALKSFLNQAVL